MHELNMHRGVVSIGIGLVVERALAFISNILLVRLLLPQDFGLVTIAFTVSEAINLLGNLGIGSALIHKHDDAEDYANAAFWLGIGVGIALGILQALLSEGAAKFYRAPLLRPILLMYAPGYLITALGNVHATLLVKNLRFDLVMRTSIVSALAGTLVSIGLAAGGLGAWSLVLGRLAVQSISTLMNWMLCKWRPSHRASRRHYSRLITYGRNMLVSDGLAYFNHNADYLILGHRFGPALLGVYLFAYNLAMLPVTTITLVVARVSFPIFAQLQRQDEDLQQAFTLAMRLSALLSFPMLVGMVILANELVTFLAGSRWQDAVAPFRLLAIYALGRSVSSQSGQLMNAMGRPDIPMKFNLIYTPIFAFGLLTGARYGMIGVAAATAVISGIATWLYLALALRLMHWPFQIALDATAPAFFSTGIMGLCVLITRQLLFLHHPTPLIMLIVLTFSGVFAYTAMLRIFYPETLQQLGLKRCLDSIWMSTRAMILH